MNRITSKKLPEMPAFAISAASARWRVPAQSSPVLWSRLEMWAVPRRLPVLAVFQACSSF
ncbi:hypothetical protein BT96DRAFT_916838, partial [Gymnopus androsaceus JB14]